MRWRKLCVTAALAACLCGCGMTQDQAKEMSRIALTAVDKALKPELGRLGARITEVQSNTMSAMNVSETTKREVHDRTSHMVASAMTNIRKTAMMMAQQEIDRFIVSKLPASNGKGQQIWGVLGPVLMAALNIGSAALSKGRV